MGMELELFGPYSGQQTTYRFHGAVSYMTFKNRMGLAFVAAAMALGCGAAQAADLSGTTAANYSWQGIYGAPATQTIVLPPVVVLLGANYATNDEMILTFSDGNAGTFMAATPATVVCAGAAAPIVVSFVSSPGPNSFLYRVANSTSAATLGGTCTWTGFALTAAALAAIPEPSPSIPGGVTVVYSAEAYVLNQPLDQASPDNNTASVATVYNQFPSPFAIAGDVVGFKGVVDVSVPSLRTLFVLNSTNCGGNNGVNNLADCTDFKTNNTTPAPAMTCGGGGAASCTAALNGTNFSIAGNFSYACNQVVNPITFQYAGGPPAAGVTYAPGCQSISFAIPANIPALNAAPELVVLTTNTDGNDLPAPQPFSATVTYTWTSSYGVTPATPIDTSTGSDGAWSLNGFDAFVAYMPYASTISQIAYLTNKSGLSGAITVTGYNTEGVACSFSAGTAAPNAVTSLATALSNGFSACYGAGFTDKVSFNVIANIPSGLAELYTAYNAGGNRNVVLNNSNGKGTFTCGALGQGPAVCVQSVNGGSL